MWGQAGRPAISGPHHPRISDSKTPNQSHWRPINLSTQQVQGIDGCCGNKQMQITAFSRQEVPLAEPK